MLTPILAVVCVRPLMIGIRFWAGFIYNKGLQNSAGNFFSPYIVLGFGPDFFNTGSPDEDASKLIFGKGMGKKPSLAPGI